MKYFEEINDLFGGPHVMKKLLQFIKKGTITKPHVQNMADCMKVAQVYDAHKERVPFNIEEAFDNIFDKVIFFIKLYQMLYDLFSGMKKCWAAWMIQRSVRRNC